MCKFWNENYIDNKQNTIKMIEHNYQDVDQEVMFKHNLDTYASFSSEFDQKSSLKSICKWMNIRVISTVNYICLKKINGMSPCTLYIKVRLDILL